MSKKSKKLNLKKKREKPVKNKKFRNRQLQRTSKRKIQENKE